MNKKKQKNKKTKKKNTKTNKQTKMDVQIYVVLEDGNLDQKTYCLLA